MLQNQATGPYVGAPMTNRVPKKPPERQKQDSNRFEQITTLTSTNWTENSVARARDGGVVVQSETVAGDYARVYEVDWGMALDPSGVLAQLASVTVEAAKFPPAGPGALASRWNWAGGIPIRRKLPSVSVSTCWR